MQRHPRRILTVVALAALTTGAVVVAANRLFSHPFSTAGAATAPATAAAADKAPQNPPSENAATHEEVSAIGLAPETRCKNLRSFCLNADGNLLLCDAKTFDIKLVTQDDKLVGTWRLGFAPNVIRPAGDGTFYVGGSGRLARVNAEGNIVKEVRSTGENFPATRPSGFARTDKDLFVSFSSGGKLGTRGIIVRFDHDFGQPTVIARGLPGCCGNLDIDARDDRVYLAENGRHCVSVFDRDGNRLRKWGEYHRHKIQAFDSCCNPMNLCFGPDGSLYTTESRTTDRIKRYAADGKFLGLVGYVGLRKIKGLGKTADSCSCAKVCIGKNAERLFALDESNSVIRVLVKKTETKPKETP